MLEVSFSPFPEIKTERLLLRRVVHADIESIFQLRSNSEVMKYIVTDAEIHFDKIEDGLANNSGINWAISFIENPQRLIGIIGLWRLIKEHYRAEIGYTLHQEFWKKGIMKEAVKAVLDFGFNNIKIHSVEAQLSPLNTASQKLLESIGFLKEAHFKENYYFDGNFSDTIVYSRLNKPT